MEMTTTTKFIRLRRDDQPKLRELAPNAHWAFHPKYSHGEAYYKRYFDRYGDFIYVNVNGEVFLGCRMGYDTKADAYTKWAFYDTTDKQVAVSDLAKKCSLSEDEFLRVIETVK